MARLSTAERLVPMAYDQVTLTEMLCERQCYANAYVLRMACGQATPSRKRAR